MQIHLHEQVPGQSVGCLEGLVRQAEVLARTPRMQRSESVDSVKAWIRAQPFVPDTGSLGPLLGCKPRQRARFWPSRGLNCWEGVLHYTAAVLAHGLPPGQELHIYDVSAEGERLVIGRRILRPGRRHVFPVIVHLPLALVPSVGDVVPGDDVLTLVPESGDVVQGREEIVELDSLVRPKGRRGAARRPLRADAVTTLDGQPVSKEALQALADRPLVDTSEPGPLSPAEVQKMAWYERLYEALIRGLAEVPSDLRKRLLKLFSWDTLWGLLLLLAFWVGLHYIGAGEIGDLGVVVYGFYVGGKAVWQVGSDFYQFARIAVSATSDEELTRAGHHFAAAMNEAMVTALETLIGSSAFRLFRAGALKLRPVPRQMKSRLARVTNDVARKINERIGLHGRQERPEDLQSHEPERVPERPEDLQSHDPGERDRADKDRERERERADRERDRQQEREQRAEERRRRLQEGAGGLGLVDGGKKIGQAGGWFWLALLALAGAFAGGRATSNAAAVPR